MQNCSYIKKRHMKTIKFLIASVLFISLASCGGDDKVEIALEFNAANLKGVYSISTYNEDLRNTTVTQGTTVDISTATKIGDTFQVNFVINDDGTYSAIGQYRVVTTVTPVSGSPTTTPQIINVDNQGTYTINTTSGVRSITFIPTNGTFLSGNYGVNLFNETSLALEKESEELNGQIRTESDLIIGFTR